MTKVTVRYRKSTRRWHVRLGGGSDAFNSYVEKPFAVVCAEGLCEGLSANGDAIRLTIHNEDDGIADIVEWNTNVRGSEMGIEEACRCIEERYPDFEASQRKGKDGVVYCKDKKRVIRISQHSVTSDLRLLLAVTKRLQKGRNGSYTVVIYRESQLYTYIEKELSLLGGENEAK